MSLKPDVYLVLMNLVSLSSTKIGPAALDCRVIVQKMRAMPRICKAEQEQENVCLSCVWIGEQRFMASELLCVIIHKNKGKCQNMCRFWYLEMSRNKLHH